MCVLSCVLSAVGFQLPNGCINKYAMLDFFENKRYGDMMDDSEVENYKASLNECDWGANALPAGLKKLQEEAQKNAIKFSIPMSIDALQDMIMDGLSALFNEILKLFAGKKKMEIAIKCQRAAYLFNCLDIQHKVNQNKTIEEETTEASGGTEEPPVSMNANENEPQVNEPKTQEGVDGRESIDEFFRPTPRQYY